MACTLIAGKVEECYRRVRDVVNIYYWLYQHLRGVKIRMIAYVSDEYYQWRDRVTTMEMIVLRELGFRVQPRHPVGLLVNYLNALMISDPRIAQRAINYVNDGLRSVAFITYQPHVIACSAISMAAIDYKLELPLDPRWYGVFDVTEADLEKCQELLRSVYSFQVNLGIPLTREEQQQQKPEGSEECQPQGLAVNYHDAGSRPTSSKLTRHRDDSRSWRSQRSRTRSVSRDRTDIEPNRSTDRYQHKSIASRSRSQHRDITIPHSESRRRRSNPQHYSRSRSRSRSRHYKDKRY